MENRVTDKDLDWYIQRINEKTGNPNGYLPGSYFKESAYGGVKLFRMSPQDDGQETISTNGYGTKRELLYFLQGMLAGIRAEKEGAKT